MTTEQETPNGEDVSTQQERNWRQMEERVAAQQAELEELRPLKLDETLREAGFDPRSDQGKAVKYGIQVNKIESDPEKVKEFALTEFGWRPKTQLTSEEASRQVTTDRMDSLNAQSEPETPPDTGDEIAAAEAEGDFAKSGMLKLASYVEQQNINQ